MILEQWQENLTVISSKLLYLLIILDDTCLLSGNVKVSFPVAKKIASVGLICNVTNQKVCFISSFRSTHQLFCLKGLHINFTNLDHALLEMIIF